MGSYGCRGLKKRPCTEATFGGKLGTDHIPGPSARLLAASHMREIGRSATYRHTIPRLIQKVIGLPSLARL